MLAGRNSPIFYQSESCSLMRRNIYSNS